MLLSGEPVTAEEARRIGLVNEVTSAADLLPRSRQWLEKVLANSRDPKQLLDAWNGWHMQSPAYKKMYTEYVDLSNKGAREMGYADTGAHSNHADGSPKYLLRAYEQVPLFDVDHRGILLMRVSDP